MIATTTTPAAELYDVPSAATLLRDYPSGLTRDQATSLSISCGLDDLTSHWLWAASSEPIPLLAWRVTTRHYLWLEDRDGRRRELSARLAAAGAVAAEFETPDGWRYIAHPSSRRRGVWQLSRSDSRGPVGHTDHDSLVDAAAAACCCSRMGPLHDEGVAEARLAATINARGIVTHHV